jgi:lysozyme family protein
MGSDVNTVFSFIVSEEGSTFTDNPADPGGCSKYGVTLSTWKNYIGDSTVTCNELKSITYLQALAVFKRNYWGVASALPTGLDLCVADMSYNAGYKNATLILQRVVGAVDDGVLGPKTLASVNAYNPAKAIIQYGVLCADYYKSLNNPVFIKGWLARNDRRVQAALNMISINNQ